MKEQMRGRWRCPAKAKDAFLPPFFCAFLPAFLSVSLPPSVSFPQCPHRLSGCPIRAVITLIWWRATSVPGCLSISLPFPLLPSIPFPFLFLSFPPFYSLPFYLPFLFPPLPSFTLSFPFFPVLSLPSTPSIPLPLGLLRELRSDSWGCANTCRQHTQCVRGNIRGISCFEDFGSKQSLQLCFESHTSTSVLPCRTFILWCTLHYTRVILSHTAH